MNDASDQRNMTMVCKDMPNSLPCLGDKCDRCSSCVCQTIWNALCFLFEKTSLATSHPVSHTVGLPDCLIWHIFGFYKGFLVTPSYRLRCLWIRALSLSVPHEIEILCKELWSSSNCPGTWNKHHNPKVFMQIRLSAISQVFWSMMCRSVKGLEKLLQCSFPTRHGLAQQPKNVSVACVYLKIADVLSILEIQSFFVQSEISLKCCC